MFSLPLSILPDTQPKSHDRQADARLGGPSQPPATTHVLTASGQRRWTVVVPRRLTARAAQALQDAEAAQSALPAVQGPIRFRPQLTMFGVIATVASGLYVYSEKHAAASLDRQIAHAFQATTVAHQQSSLLRAEWALLNNPDRLHPLADRYLSLQPLNAVQFTKVADLHSRLPRVLYGPPVPATDDDAAAPPIVTRRLLAMAEVPAPADPAPDAPAPRIQADDTADQPAGQPARTPVVAAPTHAFRVLARAGTVPAIVDSEVPDAAPPEDRGEAGVPEDDLPKPATATRPARPAASSWHQAARPGMPAMAPAPASRLAARAEPPKPRPMHPPALLRPELVHMLMMPRPLYTSTWTPRLPQSAARPVLPQHHPEFGRSDPPHFLSVPQTAPARPAESQQYAEARPREMEQPRQETWSPPVTYRPPPAYAYRPYWGGYNANPYGGYYYQPRPAYPGYQ